MPKNIKTVKAWAIVDEYGVILTWTNSSNKSAWQSEIYPTKEDANMVLRVWRRNVSPKCRIVPVLIKPISPLKKK